MFFGIVIYKIFLSIKEILLIVIELLFEFKVTSMFISSTIFPDKSI